RGTDAPSGTARARPAPKIAPSSGSRPAVGRRPPGLPRLARGRPHPRRRVRPGPRDDPHLSHGVLRLDRDARFDFIGELVQGLDDPGAPRRKLLIAHKISVGQGQDAATGRQPASSSIVWIRVASPARPKLITVIAG